MAELFVIHYRPIVAPGSNCCLYSEGEDALAVSPLDQLPLVVGPVPDEEDGAPEPEDP